MPIGNLIGLILVIILDLITRSCHFEKPEDPGSEIHVNPPQYELTPTPPTKIKITSPENNTTFISTDSFILRCELSDIDPNIYLGDGGWTIKGYQIVTEKTGGVYQRSQYFRNDLPSPHENIFTRESSPSFTPAPTLTVDGNGDFGGRNGFLYYEISVYKDIGGQNVFDSIELIQDEIDQCRQEYLDVRRNNEPISNPPPGHADFTFNTSTSHFTFSELKGDSYYNCAVVHAQVLSGLENLRTLLNNGDPNGSTGLRITTCYRNPAYNESLKNAPYYSAFNSAHLFGGATDILVRDYDNNGIEGEKNDWTIIYNYADQLHPSWIEPSDYGHPNSHNYSYIHITW